MGFSSSLIGKEIKWTIKSWRQRIDSPLITCNLNLLCSEPFARVSLSPANLSYKLFSISFRFLNPWMASSSPVSV